MTGQGGSGDPGRSLGHDAGSGPPHPTHPQTNHPSQTHGIASGSSTPFVPHTNSHPTVEVHHTIEAHHPVEAHHTVEAPHSVEASCNPARADHSGHESYTDTLGHIRKSRTHDQPAGPYDQEGIRQAKIYLMNIADLEEHRFTNLATWNEIISQDTLKHICDVFANCHQLLWVLNDLDRLGHSAPKKASGFLKTAEYALGKAHDQILDDIINKRPHLIDKPGCRELLQSLMPFMFSEVCGARSNIEKAVERFESDRHLHKKLNDLYLRYVEPHELGKFEKYSEDPKNRLSLQCAKSPHYVPARIYLEGKYVKLWHEWYIPREIRQRPRERSINRLSSTQPFTRENSPQSITRGARSSSQQGHHNRPVASDPERYVQEQLASWTIEILAYVLRVFHHPLLSEPARLAQLGVNEALHDLKKSCRSLIDLFSDPRERTLEKCSRGLKRVYLTWARSYKKTLTELKRLDDASADDPDRLKSDLILLIDTLLPCMGNEMCRGDYVYQSNPHCPARDGTLHIELNKLIRQFGTHETTYYKHYNEDESQPATRCDHHHQHIVAPALKHDVDGKSRISWKLYVPPTGGLDPPHTGKIDGRGRSRDRSTPPGERRVAQRLMSSARE